MLDRVRDDATAHEVECLVLKLDVAEIAAGAAAREIGVLIQERDGLQFKLEKRNAALLRITLAPRLALGMAEVQQIAREALSDE